MKIDSSHPLAARATSSTIAPKQLTAFAHGTRVITLKLVLPYPPSVNTIYQHTAKSGRVVKFKTAEHKRYLGAVGNAVRVAGLRDPLVDALPFLGDVKLTVRLFRPRAVGDLDNRIKALQDALNGVAWRDDEQVCELHMYRDDSDKWNARAEVQLEGEVTP